MTQQTIPSLEMLAAGMAHELNSPLASVLANTRFALDELRGQATPELAEVAEALEDALAATQRAADVVRSLQTFSRCAR